MQIFVQTTHFVIDVTKVTHVRPKAKFATVHFAGGTEQEIPIADAAELLDAMTGKAMVGLIKCVNATRPG